MRVEASKTRRRTLQSSTEFGEGKIGAFHIQGYKESLWWFFFLLLDSGKEQWEKEYEKRARLVIHLQNLYLPPAMCSFRRYVDQMCPSKPCGFSFHLCTISLLQPSWNFSILQYPAVRSFLTHQMPEEMLSTPSQQLYLMPACYCVKNGNRIAKVTGKRFQTHLRRVGAPLSNLGLRRVL